MLGLALLGFGVAPEAWASEDKRWNKQLFDDIWQFNEDQVQFNEITPVNQGPGQRQAHAVAAAQNVLFALFGQGNTGTLSDVWRYDPATNSWTQLTPGGTAPPGRSHHTATALPNGDIFVFGGLGANGQPLADMFQYHSQTILNEWSTRASHPQGPRFGHSAVLHGNKIVIWGGRNALVDLDDMWEFDPFTDQWTPANQGNNAPPQRAHHASASIEEEPQTVEFVFGGTGVGVEDLADAWRFDFTSPGDLSARVKAGPGLGVATSGTWTRLADMPAALSHAAAVAFTDGGGDVKVLVYGGQRNGQVVADAFLYDVERNSWQTLALAGLAKGAAGPGARTGHSIAAVGDDIFLFGGDDGEGPPGPCVRDANTACLIGGKFKVKLEMRDFSNPPVTFTGKVMSFPGGRAESDQAAFFDSFNPGNFELGVKMVDACSFNNKYWLFTGGLTNTEYDIEVTDTVTGATRVVSNPAGTLPLSTADTSAFDCVAGTPTCARDGNTACLLAGRFRVTARMFDFATPPNEFTGHVMQFPTDRAESDQAAFYESFNGGNFEWGVKMVDACGFNNRYWWFAGGLSNAFTRITITNTVTGQEVTYTNPAGTLPRSVADTSTLLCP
jgi:N-acetylneuraminic acid mutarotase